MIINHHFVVSKNGSKAHLHISVIGFRGQDDVDVELVWLDHLQLVFAAASNVGHCNKSLLWLTRLALN